MYIKFKGGRTKALTLSYDDGVYQDIRLMEIMDKYGLKGTFNISAGLFMPEEIERTEKKGRLKKSEALKLYKDSGHEVAIHGFTHPDLPELSAQEIVREIYEDRKGLEETFGTFVRGMAYPYGTYNDKVVDIIENCGICYSRTTKSTGRFDLPENWLTLHPTIHHNDERSYDLAHKFIETSPRYWGDVWLFYYWGHSYEFDNDANWGMIEEFAKFIGGHEDVWYATNIEIYDYVMAYKSLIVSSDKKMVYNPTSTDVWFAEDKEIYLVKAGETITL